MQLPKRAFLYGFFAWLVWMPTIMGLMMGLPDSFINSQVGAALPGILFILFVLIFALLYLRKVGQGTWQEGIYIGLLWMVIYAILDVAHYVLMGLSVDLVAYLSTFFVGYTIIPITISILFHLAKSKS